MPQITYSAPAKILFSGEHSVVHGRPALAISVDYRFNFTLQEADSMPANFDKGIQEASQIVLDYLKQNQIEHTQKNFNYQIDSNVPIGEGFGSSACLSVATTACFLEFYTGKEFDKQTIYDLAYQVEVIFHGKPSGVDPAAVCFGGLIFFRKEFEYLKTISPLPFGIPDSFKDNFYLVFSGSRVEPVLDLVALVNQRIEKYGDFVKKELFEIELATKNVITAFETANQDLLIKNMNKNQKLLEQIGVVSESTKEIIKNLLKFGAIKITGAGGVKEGSGYLLCFIKDENKSSFENYLSKNSLKSYKIVPEDEGVRRV
jgi:mevalonate kinase